MNRRWGAARAKLVGLARARGPAGGVILLLLGALGWSLTRPATPSATASSTITVPPGTRAVWDTQTKLVDYEICRPTWETKHRTITYTVTKPVWEERPREAGGGTYKVCRMVPEQRSRDISYKVCRMVREKRQKEVTYRVVRFKPVL